jgi:hypothetical protein
MQVRNLPTNKVFLNCLARLARAARRLEVADHDDPREWTKGQFL